MATRQVFTQLTLFDAVPAVRTLDWQDTKAGLSPWEQGIFDEEHGVPWAKAKYQPDSRKFARYMSGRLHAKGVKQGK